MKAARAAQADAEGMVARLRRELTTELRRVSNVAEQERTVNQREKSALRAQLEQLRRVTEQRSKLADQERSALEVEVQAAMGASREKEAILQRQVRGLPLPLPPPVPRGFCVLPCRRLCVRAAWCGGWGRGNWVERSARA